MPILIQNTPRRAISRLIAWYLGMSGLCATLTGCSGASPLPQMTGVFSNKVGEYLRISSSEIAYAKPEDQAKKFTFLAVPDTSGSAFMGVTISRNSTSLTLYPIFSSSQFLVLDIEAFDYNEDYSGFHIRHGNRPSYTPPILTDEAFTRVK
jgi:hypothetical protein